VKAGEMTLAEFMSAESGMSRSPGHCMTYGHGLDHGQHGGIARHRPARERRPIPAVDSRRKRLAHLVGNRAVEIVKEDLRISKVLTREAFQERDPRQRRDRRLDQRGGASARHRWPPQGPRSLAE
jgi:dihydroxy-acid dehydratase